jgi:hypothetical protein
MNYKLVATAVVAALAAANGVLHLVDDSVATQVVGLLAALGLYLLPSPFQASGKGGGPAGLPLLLVAVAVGLLGGPVPEARALPWRRQVEQRLQQLERQAAAPVAPAAPQIIYLPYQTLPIAGAPKQELPGAGRLARMRRTRS